MGSGLGMHRRRGMGNNVVAGLRPRARFPGMVQGQRCAAAASTLVGQPFGGCAKWVLVRVPSVYEAKGDVCA